MDNPQVVGNRFELGHLIGEGGVGRVYRGLDTQTGELVAVKLLRPEIILELPELVERFRREGEVLRELNHPNIVTVLTTFEEGDQHYIIMEYVGGGSLADLLRNQPQLPLKQALAIALEVADALTRAHHLNIIHRDIKPGNILLAKDGTPRLTDFGLAHIERYPPITVVGDVVGTFQYLSPEGCNRQTLDERTDIWSFGVVLFEMLAGERPFDGGGYPGGIVGAILNQPAPNLAGFRDDVPPALDELIGQMLAKNPGARLASMRLVGADLEAIIRGTERPPLVSSDPRLATPPRPRRDLPAQAPPGEGQRKEMDSAVRASDELRPPPTHSKDTIKVLIVDDHAMVRQGLRTFLSLHDTIEVVGEAANGVEAVEQVRQLRPNVVLMDLVMPELDGIEATRRIRTLSPETQVLALTSFTEDEKVFPAIEAGALGYLLKDVLPDDLVQAIEAAYRGEAQLHPDITKKLMGQVAARARHPEPAPPHASKPAPDELTERELEVLRLIATGLSNREIAQALTIAEKTVKTHVSNILSKLHLADRTQAAIYALHEGLGPEE